MLPLRAPQRNLLLVALVSILVVPGCLANLLLRATFSSRVMTSYHSVPYQNAMIQEAPYQNVTVQETTQASPENSGIMMEVSLQETLDRLGYTVNVPTVYGGHRLLRWNDYRLSTRDDSLPETGFSGRKSSHFTKLSEQAMLAGNLEFGVKDAQGNMQTLLQPDHNQNTYWISANGGQACTASLADANEFYINDTTQTFQTGPYSSTTQTNADRTPHLLALPARTGGQWVEEGDNTGHWEGGKDTGGILLCWEDWNDFDYQDLVILADDVVPNKCDPDTHIVRSFAAIHP